MPLSVWYWIGMFLWLVFGCWSSYVTPPPERIRIGGFSLLLFLLLLIVGLKLFGSPIQGG